MRYDPNKWFVRDDGKVYFLRMFQKDRLSFVQHPTYIEVMLLGPDDGEPGREVQESYVLHEGDPKTEFEAWGGEWNPNKIATRGTL